MRDSDSSGTGARGGPPGPPRAALPPVLTAVATTREALADVATAWCWSLSDADVETALTGVVAARAQLDELGLRLLAAAGQREIGGAAGSASMASWWAARSGRTRADAGADVRLADALDRLDATRAALCAGVMSVEQAAVVGRAVADLPPDLAPEQRVQAEEFLTREAAGPDGARRLERCRQVGRTAAANVPAGPLGLGPNELARLGHRLFEVIDPDRADEHEGKLLEAEEARARRLSWLRMRSAGDGTTRGSFRLPNAQADMLRTVLEAYASPRRERSKGTDGSAAESSAGSSSSDIHTAGLGEGAFEPGGAETTPTTHTYDQRLGWALCELLEHVPIDGLPQSGGVAATVTVAIDHTHLLDGVGAATLSTGARLSAGQIRRLACGAGLLPLVFDGESVVLDAGRERRLYDRYARLAMAARDHGCVFPGCDRPAAWAEAHHLTPWASGGRTDVNDGCLLCSFHHHLVHAGEWEAQMGTDGVPEVLPPARIDPTRSPRRHERFHKRSQAPRR